MTEHMSLSLLKLKKKSVNVYEINEMPNFRGMKPDDHATKQSLLYVIGMLFAITCDENS